MRQLAGKAFIRKFATIHGAYTGVCASGRSPVRDMPSTTRAATYSGIAQIALRARTR
jgi:hypothetical protein